MITRPAENPFTTPDILADGGYGTREALHPAADVPCPQCHHGAMIVVRTTIRRLPLRRYPDGAEVEGLGSFDEAATVDCPVCGVSYSGEQWAQVCRALGVS